MNYDEFISFMAEYNQRLYPDHNNMWNKIHRLDHVHLDLQTIQSFKSFKSKLSTSLRNLSKADIEKLLTTANGPRPHPNTFILKKLGISSRMYTMIRYAVFNHTRHAEGNNPNNLVPIAKRNVPKPQDDISIQYDNQEPVTNNVNERIFDTIQGIQEQVNEMKSDFQKMLEDIKGSMDEKLRGLRKELNLSMEKHIQDQISKENGQGGSNFLSALAAFAVGGSAGAIVGNIIENTENAKKIDELSQEIGQIKASLVEQQKTIDLLYNWANFISNISNGFNYLRLFGVPITWEEWNSLPDDLKHTWSPEHIKPPVTSEMRNAIAKCIKEKSPPTVDLFWDIPWS